MPYNGELSNPFGLSDFLAHVSEQDIAGLRKFVELKEKLVDSLADEHCIHLADFRAQHALISVAVDGGSQMAFPALAELSIGIIRVSAASLNFRNTLPDLVQLTKNYELFQREINFIATDSERERERDSAHKASVDNFLDKLFSGQDSAGPTIKRFSELTGITREDLGEYVYKDIQSFTTVLRDILEWAYIVDLANKYTDFNCLFLKDGRLAQAGVEHSFREKLKKFFSDRRTLIVGAIKGTKLLREGLSAWVIYEWVKNRKHRFVLRIPDTLMKYVYNFEKQWNPEYARAYVFGNRYLIKLFPQELEPLESVVTFDVPDYLVDDEKAIKGIASTLYEARSILFGGSIQVVSDAHARASVRNSIVEELEREIERRLGVKIPFKGKV